MKVQTEPSLFGFQDVARPGRRRRSEPEIARNCPTYPDNIKKGLKIDAKFWFGNQASVIERFNGWVLK